MKKQNKNTLLSSYIADKSTFQYLLINTLLALFDLVSQYVNALCRAVG